MSKFLSGARRCLIALLLIVQSAAVLRGEPSSWRHWLATDGLHESYSRTIGFLASGSIAVRHGRETRADILDGYSVRSIPDPRTGTEAEWIRVPAINAVAGGEPWIVIQNRLKEFRNGAWTVRASAGPGEEMISAFPLNAEDVLVLFADRLAIFHARDEQWKVLVLAQSSGLGDFRSMARGFSGQIWVAAAYGLGRLSESDKGWISYPTAAYSNFEYPHPADGDEVFMAAVEKSTGRHVLLRLDGGRYRHILDSTKDLRGWRGVDSAIWVLEGATLWTISESGKERVDKQRALAGVIYDVRTQPQGRFWIASNVGLSHYTPALWRTPRPVRHIDQPVHDITEDAKGRIWFAATEYLLEHSPNGWNTHPLPDGYRTQTTQTQSMTVLRNGRIAFTALHNGNQQHLLTYDPGTRRFQVVVHPDGKASEYIWTAGGGQAWVKRKDPCRLELWDGSRFTQPGHLKLEPLCSNIRFLHKASDESIWIGTTALAGGVYRPGAANLVRFGSDQGYTEPGVYTLYEHARGRILAGARHHVHEFDGSRWRVVRSGMDAVRSILRTRDGTLWIASGSGIHRLQNGGWITNGEAEGLPSDTAYKIFEDSRGRLWAGSSRGVSLFDPSADTEAPRAIISTGNSTEAPPDGNVSIAFAGVDRWKHTAPERLLFSYRIDSGPWSEFATVARGLFNDIQPGKHTFQVRAMDRNGNLSRDETFHFAVAFPWYRQTGFLFLTTVGVVAIGLLIGLAAYQYRQLARAKCAAESASQCKSDFLASMSHEIRTPMNAIMGMTELAAEIAVSREQKEYLDIVQSSSASLLALLNDILDFSKVEAGKLQLSPQDFDVQSCVDDAIRTLRLKASEKELLLHSIIEPEVPRFLHGDDLRLRQIFLNLLGNAIKFTPSDGRVLLRVGMGPESDSDVRLHFVICDTGIGIPAEKQRIIFQPFEQADSSTSRSFGGTGLGLAICSQLVQLMRGDIWVESPWTDPDTGEKIAGSAVHFTAEFEHGSQTEDRESGLPTGGARSLSVLLVEDNAVNQRLAKRILEKLGHTVTTCGDGEEAVRVYPAANPDVVLMDVQIPKMNGFEATAAIREIEKKCGKRRTPIVALTAHALQGYRNRCLQAGMDEYLCKPINLEQLSRALSQVDTVSPR